MIDQCQIAPAVPVSLIYCMLLAVFHLSQGFADVSTVGTTNSSAEKPGLPDGWNSADVYTLQYRQNASGRKALVKGIKMEGDLLILNMAVSIAAEIYRQWALLWSCDGRVTCSNVMVM